MSVSGTPVTTYYDGFPKAHPSLPPSPRRSGRGVVQRRDCRGIPTITAELKPACRHSSRRSDLEHRGEGGRGGGGLGKTVVVRRDRCTGNRQAGGLLENPIRFSPGPPAPPAPPRGGGWVAIISNTCHTARCRSTRGGA